MTAETPAPQHGRDCDPGCGCRDPKRAIPPTHVILQRLDVEVLARAGYAAAPALRWTDEPQGRAEPIPWDEVHDSTKQHWRRIATALRASILGGVA